MFMYTQSGEYGKDPEMRHSHGRTNKLKSSHGNNNNCNDHNEQLNIPFCNSETAFNYCTNVGVIGSPWNLSNIQDFHTFAKSSPAKTNTPRAILCSPKYAPVPLTEPPLQYFDQSSSYVQRKGGATTTRRNNNGLIYQQLHQQSDYYSGSNVSRQYAHSKGVSASQPVPRNEDVLKRQMKTVRDHCDYVDDGSEYSMHRRDPITQSSWSKVISDRSPRFQSANQHYDHYFSYFYNRGKQQLPKKKLHSAVCSFKPMSLLEDTPSPRSQSNSNQNRTISNDNNNQSDEYDGCYVLSENNEMPFGYNDNEWVELDDVAEKPNIVCNDKLFEPKDDYIYDDKFDPNNKQTTHRRFVQQHSENNEQKKKQSVETLTPSNGNNNGNNTSSNAETKKAQKATESNSHSRSEQHLYPRLPLTPKRVRGGQLTAKKILPTVHRVLLYNSQSPRLTRKHHSTNSRNQNVKAPNPKGQSGGQDVGDHLSNNYLEDTPETKEFRDVDFDNDDDLDNISNFDESDTVSLGSDTEDGYRAHAYKMAHSADRLSSSPKNSLSLLLSQSSDDDLRNPDSVLVPSLFPYVPPYLSFSSNSAKGPNVPPELHRVLKWRVTSIMPKVVRLILANSGMRMLKKTNDWMGVWGKHLKSPCFKTIRSYQKINHLPGSFRIGRKDSCWKNLQRQMKKHSNREFGFMPRTYVIPNDLGALRKRWPVYAQRNTKWIIKPPASARGAGIRVVNRWGQIPKRRPLIVQKYIERPLLINGSKFDLRLYVLVTSVNPLRVFMYHNGLARFASVKYSAKIDTLNDRCMHLTNYSINKFSSNYSKNEDVNACHGHKWTIKSLWTYLANRGVRTDGLWEALRSLVLRTILAGENGINSMIRANVESKYSCFELFGFDVILDSDLVPWLLEVNISPSLHSELPLDAHVKAPLVQGVLNTALYNIPPKLTSDKQRELAAEFCFPPGTQMCYDKRLYINYLSRDEKIKHLHFTRKSMENREEYINAILQNLTPDDVRCLIVAEDELARCSPLERIFPTDQTYKYLKYNDTPRYYNRLLDAWESRYGNNRTEGIALLRDLCQNKYHLQVPIPPAKKDSSASPNDDNVKKPTCNPEENSDTDINNTKALDSEAYNKTHTQHEDN